MFHGSIFIIEWYPKGHPRVSPFLTVTERFVSMLADAPDVFLLKRYRLKIKIPRQSALLGRGIINWHHQSQNLRIRVLLGNFCIC